MCCMRKSFFRPLNFNYLFSIVKIILFVNNLPIYSHFNFFDIFLDSIRPFKNKKSDITHRINFPIKGLLTNHAL